jgi:glutaredoxin 3
MPAPRITVYTKQHCPYCVRAKHLLARKGFAFVEIDVERDDALREWLREKTGQLTVPQIFAGDRPLGGFSDVSALDAEGKLDAILRGEA